MGGTDFIAEPYRFADVSLASRYRACLTTTEGGTINSLLNIKASVVKLCRCSLAIK